MAISQGIVDSGVALIELYRQNPVLAAKDLLYVDLAVPQRKILTDMWFKDYIIVSAGRGCGKCVRGETIVLTDKGMFPIESLGSNLNPLSDIDLSVAGFKGLEKASKWYYDGNQKVNDITTTLGYTLGGTDEHRIKVLDENDNIVWKRLEDVVVGDYVVFDKKTNLWSKINRCDKEQAYELGITPDLDIIPWDVLQSTKEVVVSFLQGFFEKNTYIKNGIIFVFLHNKEIARQLQTVLLNFGIVSNLKEHIKQNCIIIDYYNSFIVSKEIGFRAATYKNLLPYTNSSDKYFFDKVDSKSTSFADVYDLVVPKTHSFVANGMVNHNTFINAVFACLYALLYPGQKVGLLAPSFRQAKSVFFEVEKLWSLAPLFQEATTRKPVRQSDRCILEFRQAGNRPGSIIEAVPLGDGCLASESFVTLSSGFKTFGELIPTNRFTPDESVFVENNFLWSNGQFRVSDEKYYNGIRDTLKVTTKNGYTLEGTLNHKIKVQRQGKVVWSRFDELTWGDKLLIDCSYRWHLAPTKISAATSYKLGVEAAKADNDKPIVNQIRTASRESVSSFIRGLYDSASEIIIFCADKKAPSIDLVHHNKNLIEALQYIFLHFGIITHRHEYSDFTELRPLYLLSIEEENIVKFSKEIGLSSGPKAERLNYIVTSPLYSSYNKEEIYYDEILTIERGRSATFDLHVPDGHEYCASGFFSHNSKIRGARYYAIVADEFAQIPVEIYNTVILPMGATEANPMENVRRLQEKKELIKRGLAVEADFEKNTANKFIMTSSAFYRFNHMYETIASYELEIDKGSNKHAVHRVSYRNMPEGFLSEGNLRAAKARLSDLEFRMEYEAEWVADSAGIFKASLINKCKQAADHTVKLAGDPGKEYILGVDPARTSDAFALCLLEAGMPHKVVSAWEHYNMAFPDMSDVVMNICKDFNVIAVHMDAGGGGLAIKDLLGEEARYGESRLLDAEDENSMHLTGRPILFMANFSPKWIQEANYGTLNLLEKDHLTFPKAPQVLHDGNAKLLEKKEKIYDTVDTMIRQLLLIEVTENKSGTAHFNVPTGGGHAAQKKDLYTSFILAAKKAYDMTISDEEEDFILHLGIAEDRDIKPTAPSGQLSSSLGITNAPVTGWGYRKTFKPGK